MRLHLFAAFFLLSSAAGSPAHAGCADAEITISAPTLSTGSERSFEKRFRDGLRRVCDWWGPAYDGAFRIEVDDSRGPSMALVPAWRGNHGTMLFRAGAVTRERTAITHEIVHVLAPNANRFLAEGLAVYAHHLLEGEPAYPNFGKELTDEARKLAERADIGALERLATPKRLQLNGFDGQSAYIVAGSFVGFLIETHGLEKFRELYAMTPLVSRQRNAGSLERWQQVYGMSLDDLATDWRTSIAE